MGPEDLSSDSYKAIISESEEFNQQLKTQFGALGKYCKNEDEYLAKAKLLIGDWKKLSTTEINDLFLSKPPQRKDFMRFLDRVLQNINRVEEIPYNKRNFEL